jgi:hypothetical protein
MSTDTIDLDHLTENDTRYDEIFLSVLQSQGKIEPFIDCFFKFLYRRYLLLCLIVTYHNFLIGKATSESHLKA